MKPSDYFSEGNKIYNLMVAFRALGIEATISRWEGKTYKLHIENMEFEYDEI